MAAEADEAADPAAVSTVWTGAVAGPGAGQRVVKAATIAFRAVARSSGLAGTRPRLEKPTNTKPPGACPAYAAR
jgi:hypothetical protein